MENILNIILSNFDITREEIMSLDRQNRFVWPRIIFSVLARKDNIRINTFRYIGDYLSRQYSTIIHYLRIHNALYENEIEYRLNYDHCEKLLKEFNDGWIIEENEEIISTKYGKRKAIVTKKYNRYE